MEEKHGFKRLTIENWQQPDDIMKMFACLDADGRPRSMTGDDWAMQFLVPQLSDSVPVDIQKLFEVARGSLIYGFFFYPLYTLAQEQLFRVIEAAVMTKCELIGAPEGVRSFRNGVEWLISQKVIDTAEVARWIAMVDLRNYASHAREQSILPPGQALTSLRYTAEDISMLFT